MTRLHGLGVATGLLPPGVWNAITDVFGVRIGHATLDREVAGAPWRTGVTTFWPHEGNPARQRVLAATLPLKGKPDGGASPLGAPFAGAVAAMEEADYNALVAADTTIRVDGRTARYRLRPPHICRSSLRCPQVLRGGWRCGLYAGWGAA